MEMDKAKEHIRGILALIGEDPNREGLVRTPDRVVESWKELYSGYGKNPEEVLSATFSEGLEFHDEMVFCGGIAFWSMCEHHMLPFFGKVHIGYIPKERVVGLSKLVRLVDIYARRLQIQERMTSQIAEALETYVGTRGVGVVVTAEHLCMRMRGVKNHGSRVKTSRLLGGFEDHTVRAEFFTLVNSAGERCW